MVWILFTLATNSVANLPAESVARQADIEYIYAAPHASALPTAYQS
jgi:hypothetical protein